MPRASIAMLKVGASEKCRDSTAFGSRRGPRHLNLLKTAHPATIPAPRGTKLARYWENVPRMSSPSSLIWDDRQPLALGSTGLGSDRRLERAAWAFVGLGVLLRIARYLMNCPLWWDEAFVAVNFIRRDFLDLLRPLDYGQVCPIFFLWYELAVVKLLGFSEWSLRLFPVVSSIAGVILFRHLASCVVRGVPLLLAVAIFATSFHPILYATEVKPYASDSLAALTMLALAVEWWRAPRRARWMWAMAVTAPVAIALSHPAIFIAAGYMLGLVPTVIKARRGKVWIAYAAFSLSSTTAFVSLYLVFTRAQAVANLTAMQAQWAAAFPPLDDPFTLIKWLARAHTGSMFAYPCGGESGASSRDLLALCRGGRHAVVSRSEGDRAGLLGPVWDGRRGCGHETLPLRRPSGTWLGRASHAIPRAEYLPFGRHRGRGRASALPRSPKATPGYSGRSPLARIRRDHPPGCRCFSSLPSRSCPASP